MSAPERESWAATYPDNWKNFTRANAVYYGILVLALLYFVAGSFWHGPLPTAIGKWSFYLLLLVWIPLGFIVDGWKCPRCQKRFSPSAWENMSRSMRNPDFSGNISGYVMRLPGRLTSILQGKGDDERQDNTSPAARCRHCGLPKH